MKSLNNAVIPIWKPTSIRSNDIVNIIKKKYKLKTGHAGTLDPFAEGVLVICTGNKTKEVSKIQSQNKKYLAKVLLGKQTNTLDIEGDIIRRKSLPRLDENKIKNVLNTFKGKIMQRPPAFSALRKNSIRLYRLARKDIYINLKPREVEIFSIKLKKFKNNYLDIEVVCSKGTYIRSLAKDIAIKLGTVGYLYSLKRLSVGLFDKKDCDRFKFILDENL